MKIIDIKYNPYNRITKILVDGKQPKKDSSLNVEERRLQEWVDKLPSILKDECTDVNFKINFTGLLNDFEDVKSVFDSHSDMNVEFSHTTIPEVEEVEKKIDAIFEDIQKGPIADLKDPKIIEAFKKAKDMKFDINVVATMSSGKSTLINAMLGKRLMPAANEATTATIVRITDNDKPEFSAKAYDRDGVIVKQFNDVTYNDMKTLNDDKNIVAIDIEGDIPFVPADNMQLVLVDTPGPNNSRDAHHQEMTYNMLKDSDRSLVLFVMNGGQLGINDEKNLLDYVCEQMKNGGKSTRDRYIFAVNKMNDFKPKDEGEDCIKRALDNVRNSLEERGIINPNIFPVTAGVALERRSDDDEPQFIDVFKRQSDKYKCMHFEEYYQYNHLPQSVQSIIDGLKSNCSDNELVEIHSGIVSIEQAISQYINKYARTSKVHDLVLSFNSKLRELSTIAKLKAQISKDKSAKEKMLKQIEDIKIKIQKANDAQELSSRIEDIDFETDAQNKISSYMKTVSKKLNDMIAVQGRKMLKSSAKTQCDQLRNDTKAIVAKMKVEIQSIIEKSYKSVVSETIGEYKSYLSQLNINDTDSSFNISPFSMVVSEVADLNSIISDNIEEVDEGYYTTEAYTERVEGGFFRKTFHYLTFGLVDDYTEEISYRDEWVSNWQEYVDMHDVAADYIQPILDNIVKNEKKAKDYVASGTRQIKNTLKMKFAEINKLVEAKLSELASTEDASKRKTEEIAKKDAELEWLESIQNRVNSIVEF